jgi:pimeloyl-ACP methyl ester carboxylesterase
MSQSESFAIPMRSSERRFLGVIRGMFRVLDFVAPGFGGRLAYRIFVTPRRHNPPAFEAEIKARGESVSLSFGDLRLEGHTWGTGPAVLLIHGWEGRGAQLGRFVEPLVEAGYQAIAFDGPAHGVSEGKQIDGHQFAESLVAIQEQFGPFVGVIAHSFGGATAQYALRLGFRPGRVVLIGVPDRLSRGLGRFRSILQLRDRVYKRALEQLHGRLGSDPAGVLFTGDVADVHPPSLVIHDKGDLEVPIYEGEALYESLRNGQLHVTEGLGHRRILKDPDVIARAVAFVIDS